MNSVENTHTLEFTGERFVPGLFGGIEAEHLHRYLLARQIAIGLDVLDVASGEGYGSAMLANVARSVIGVDISGEAVAHASEKYRAHNLNYYQGDCAAIPIESSSIDLVVSFETIEHHTEHEAMLCEIQRVLRPNGLLIISSPNRPEYNKTLYEPNEYHVKELDFMEFSELLGKYFISTKFYAQRVLTGSVLAPVDSIESGFINYRSYQHIEQSQSILCPVYFIALAGNNDLPVLGNSVFECTNQPVSDYQILEAKVYLTEFVDGLNHFGGEERAYSMAYMLDARQKCLDIYFPSDLRALRGLRLDISNDAAAIHLHDLSLHDGSGHLIWKWNGKSTTFVNHFGVFFLQESNGVELLCVDGDPRFDLDIPHSLLDKVRPGHFLRISFTPKTIQTEVRCLVSKLLDQGLFEEHNSMCMRTSSGQLLAPVEIATSQFQQLANNLGSVYELLEKYKKSKEELCEQQRRRILSLQDELLRSEAQLDLLKEVMLGDREEDFL